MCFGVELYVGETVLTVYVCIHLIKVLLFLKYTFAPKMETENLYETFHVISD
jgi:uncharacterized membrane protein YeiB